uniref:Uncharacterized protein n=1 Tax=Macrostomum lignano TaxID=282301 RepID=A0A1I8FH80_9PLAT
MTESGGLMRADGGRQLC